MRFTDLLQAVITGGVPLFALSFALVAWALHRGWLTGESVRELQGSIEALGKARKDKAKQRRMDPALARWFRFGGGFYGLVALYTWLLIEWEDFGDFLGGLLDALLGLQVGALIGLLVELFVESMINFGLALGWPAYWLAESRDAWLLFFAAYGGYWLGIKAAHQAWRRGWVGSAIDRAGELLKWRE